MILRCLLQFQLLLLIPFLAACAGEGRAHSNDTGRLQVVATTGMIGDLARIIGGGEIDVTVLMGPGTDPHLYTPRRSDVVRLSKADLILYHGLDLEGKLKEALEGQSGRIPVIAVGDQVALRYEVIDEGGVADPHLWMDVSAWIIAAEVIRDTLAGMRPGDETTFAENTERLIGDLEALDMYIQASISSLPDEKRILITAHDAFGYFGRAYGVEVHGVQGISTESEAGLRDINRLVSMIVERKIPAVFAESTVSDRLMLSLKEGAGARGHSIRLGGELYSDAMGPSGGGADTYIGMMRHNVDTIVSSMGGRPASFDQGGGATTP